MTRSNLLIVDDSAHVHKLVRAHLEHEPVIVHSAYDGESALSAAVELRPSLVLLDVDMPQLDGFEVCRRLKVTRSTAQTPVIFVTADGLLTDKVRGLEMGAVDYITKPFKPEDLQARVRAALRAKSRLDKVSMVDALTGLWNRTYLDLYLPPQLSLARRWGLPLSCVCADVDELGRLNEKGGQAAGDQALRSIGQILLSRCRAEDMVAHLGSGKFAMILPATSQGAAGHLAERLRGQIERHLQRKGDPARSATCSFGISGTDSTADGSLLDQADSALYRAKKIGRNAVCGSNAAPSGPLAA